ncbi:thiazole biosynthesis adenylyltransferase ThiF [Fictibacillus sp. WQ 8-8]|uniref:thiazole biosynthesis adenylyltransferase ThiF n=1 Tax=Fictibacillus sp. WQ 8-8 TaxID=2938788 RepID=UPI0008F00B48|nr:thiazole biosynthesis adenylyltransferase ThiF [Fictibacillus sp. WQ 8-8]MCQ6266888.1 thiazole biosynthesis adenylyltransferase ThiF [Fictibacillus sp. WQ 8-8]SFF15804.1 Molybdopterin or thiamine biosynthesis adenylyltransferase [Bacillus sp. OV194]
MNDRYSRQMLFEPIGEEGQDLLSDKHVVIIGAGALGTGNAEILARAGVGRITIADRDYVEWSNLQRQQLFSEEDAKYRMPKAVAARERLEQVNSDIHVEGLVLDAGAEELRELTEFADLIIDATDNFDTRLLINDISQEKKIPWIYGACVGSYGLSYVILPGETPCLSCLLEKVPMGGATCDTAGIIAPVVQMVVAHQTSEALKLLTGNTAALRYKLVSFDVWNNHYLAMDVQKLKKTDCPSCGEHPQYPHLNPENQTKTAVLCGRNTVQIRPSEKGERDLDELSLSLSRLGGKVEQNPYLLSYSNQEEQRLVFFKDGRVLIHGTKDITEAKNLYYSLIG